MSAKAIPALVSIPEGTVLERLSRSLPSVVAGLGLAGAGRSGRPKKLSQLPREATLSDVSLSVPDGSVRPLAAMLCTYQLGLARHGEVLILYERPSDSDVPGDTDYALDIFDRMAIKVNSAMRAAFATSESPKPRGRRSHVADLRSRPARLRAHYVRGFTAKAERGYKLRDRRVHVHVDLSHVEPVQLNRAITDAVCGSNGLHQQGFSYLGGAHCVQFANELTAVLQQRCTNDGTPTFGVLPVDQFRAQAPRMVACFNPARAAPRLGEYLRRVGFGEAVSQFEGAESAIRQQQSNTQRVRAVIESLIDPGDCWLPRGVRAKVARDTVREVATSSTCDKSPS